MKVQASPIGQLTRTGERLASQPFAGRAVSLLVVPPDVRPLAAQLRASITLVLWQEQALQRLLQREHTPLSCRNIRLP